MKIGIDFGTCFSTVATVNGGRAITGINVMDYEKNGVPSLFMYSKANNIELYGPECLEAEGAMHEEDVVRYIKRTIRETKDPNKVIYSGGRTYKAIEIVEKYIRKLIEQAIEGAVQDGEIKNPDKIEEITITSPVGIESGSLSSTGYNELLLDIVEKITKLPRSKIHIINEPVAAAISFLFKDTHATYEEPQKILVFDMGGGTLDVAVYKYIPNSNKFEVLAKDGDLYLGGNDFDKELVNLVLKKSGHKESDFTSQEEKLKFYSLINRAKHSLSLFEETIASYYLNRTPIACSISRTEFEQCTKYLMDRAINITKRTLNDVSGGIKSIDKFVLVGGASNMPMVKERLAREFREIANRIEINDPSRAIAKGAAIYSHIKKPDSTTKDVLPKIIDISNATYGFDCKRTSIDNDDWICNVIYYKDKFKDGKIKAVAKGFTATHEDQKNIVFNVYESKILKNQTDNEKGSDEGFIKESDLECKPNGIKLTVKIPEKYWKNNKSQEFSVDYKFTLYETGTLVVEAIDNVTGDKLAYVKQEV